MTSTTLGTNIFYHPLQKYCHQKYIMTLNSIKIHVSSKPNPRVPFHKGFVSSKLKSCENSPCCDHNSNDPIRSQFCTCHHNSAVVTCAKSWPDGIIISQEKAAWIFTSFGWQAHQTIVEHILGRVKCSELKYKFHQFFMQTLMTIYLTLHHYH